MHDDSLIRVFSARDYETYNNSCAVISVTLASGEVDRERGQLAVRPQVLKSFKLHTDTCSSGCDDAGTS